MPEKDQQWFDNIKWSESCIKCQRETGGACAKRYCAEFQYDEWGDRIPDWLYYHDGNNVAEYLEEKRRQKEAEKANG